MASSSDIKNVQKIHSLPQTGVYDSKTTNAIKNYQGQWHFAQTGVLDNQTLAKYKATWPYAWGIVAGPPTSGTVSPYNPSPAPAYDMPSVVNGGLGLVINGAILFGIYKVLHKVL